MEQRSEFLDVASHQLRTPVSVIMGTISLFKEGSTTKLSEAEREKFISNIYVKAKKLTTIINDILDASEMDTTEAFQLTAEYIKPVDVRDVAKGVIDDLQSKADERKLK